MDQTVIMKGILDSYPYPIVFVDDTFTTRFLNRRPEDPCHRAGGWPVGVCERVQGNGEVRP